MSLVLLEPNEIRLGRRPGAIASVWAVRAAFAWAIAAPVAHVLGGEGVDQFPRGDALLFQPGGGYLLETLRLAEGPLLSELRHAAWLTLLFGYLSLVPLAGLMVALAHRGRLDPSEFVARGLRHLPHFGYLAGLTWLAQAVVALAGATIVLFLEQTLSASHSVRSVDLWSMSVAALVLVLVLAVGVVQDLARAACVRFGDRVGGALKDAFATLCRRPGAVLRGYAVPAAWSVVIVLFASVATEHLHVERGGTWSLIAIFGLHQLVVLALVVLRSSWLSRSLVLIAPTSAPSALDN